MMSKNCKDCERLNPKASGTAPERPVYKVATMYDHFATYQRFTEEKEDEENMKVRKEELGKVDARFTNCELANANSDLVSTTEVERFRLQLRCHNCALSAGAARGRTNESQPAGPAVHKSQTNRTKPPSLKISRLPVFCPISRCAKSIGSSSLLSHILRDHYCFGIQCHETYDNKRSELVFDVTNMHFHDIICLGVLAYGGLDTKSSSRPAERGICLRNAFLTEPYKHLEDYMPILIMGCRTSWTAMLKDKALEADITDAEDPGAHLLLIWLVGVQTTTPVHCTLTIYDRTMITSRSTIIKVRNVQDSQNPSHFMRENTNYLRLTQGDVNLMTNNETECIHMEVMINEYKK